MTSPDLTGAKFYKSSLSGGTTDNCVEVATNLPDVVAVRDSKDPFGSMLTFSPAAWRDFLRGVRNGDL
ncbi:DUF397 domain-containing protein [Streptosporangium sp. NPDC051023]|uniref:DUF397 domain-containing protein n=1 Tax=Streptosporangium sp. NPDC051023 TaxID=3155410 RepID=UPI0034503647